MFENMNPLDRPTAFLEIGILLFISFILGYIAARVPIPTGKIQLGKKSNVVEELEEEVDPRDIITEPTTIKAVLTRDRKGNAITPIKPVETSTKSPANE